MGDNALELDVYLKLHMSELVEAAFKGIEKAAKRTASSIENVFANSLKKIQSKIATTFNANVFTNLTNAAKNAGAQIDNAITKPMSKAGKTVSTAFNFNKLTSGLSRLQKSISSAFNFTKLIVGVRVLQSAFDKVMKAVKAFASTTLSIQKGIITAFGKISASVIKTASDISGLSLMLKSIPAAASAIGSTFSKLLPSFDFADLLKQSVMLSSSLTEVKNVVDIVFKDGAQEIYNFAQGAIENLGMTTLAAEQFAGKFGAALQTTGQSAQSTLQMSKALTQLTADLASFYDIEQDVAAEKLFSGVISGQVRPMRELGVDMSKASLEAYALSEGYSKLYKDMSAVEKQALRFNYAMDKLNFVSGDYARTINSTANQIRLLKNQFKELGSIVGSIINAFFNPLIHVLNRVVAALVSVAKTIAGIMGIDWTLGTGSGVAGVGGVADSYDELAESADDLADAEDGVAGATDKAAKAAKKALAPFHKLNVLQNQSAEDSKSGSGGKSGGGGMFDIGDSIDTAEAGTVDLKKAFKNLYDYLMGLDWRKIFSRAADAVNAFFEELPRKIREFFEAINALWKKILDGINVFIAKLKTYNIGASIAALFKGIGDLIYSALTIIDYKMLGKKFGELLNGIIDNAALFLRWGAVLGAAIQDAFEFLLESVKEIQWSELGRNIYYALDGALDEIDPNTIYTAIVTTFNSVTEAILSFFTNLSQNKEDMDKIAKLIVTFINGVASFIGSEQFVELVSTIFDFLSTELGKVNEYFEQYGVQEKIVNGLATLIEEAIRFVAGEDYSTFVGNIWGTIGKTLSKVYEDLKADGTIDRIKDGISKAVGEGWEEAKKIILGLFDSNGDGDIWDELATALSTGFEKVKEAIYKVFGVENFAQLLQKVIKDAINSVWILITSEELSWDVKLVIGLAAASKLGLTSLAGTIVQSLLGKIATGIGSLFTKEVGPAVKAGFESVFGKGKVIEEAIKTPMEEAATATDTLTTSLENAGNAASSGGLSTLSTTLLNIGTSLSGISGTLGGIIGLIEGGGAIAMVLAMAADAKNFIEGVTTDLDTLKEKYGEQAVGIRQVADVYNSMSGTYRTIQDDARAYNEYIKIATEEGKAAANDYLRNWVEQSEITRGALITNADGTVEAIGAALDKEKEKSVLNNAEITANREEENQKRLESDAKVQAEIDRLNQEHREKMKQASAETTQVVNTDTESRYQKEVDSSSAAAQAVASTHKQMTDDITSDNDNAAKAIENTYKAAKDAVETGSKETTANVKQDTTLTADDIKKIVSDLIDWLVNDGFETLKTSVKELITMLKEDLTGAVDDVLTAWERLNESVKSWSDSMANALDNAADSASKLADKLKEAASAQKEYNSARNSSSSSSNRGYPSSVQGYANGGVFLPNKPQLAILGDNKSQTEYALTTGHLQQIADMMANTIGSIVTGSDQPITIPIYLGNELIDQRVITAGQMHNYRSNGR